MEQQSLKQTIIKILDDHQIGTMASVEQDKPYSRYMTFFHEDITLYTATNKQTHKVKDIKQNPHVHILLGYTFDDTTDKYIEIEGEASVHDEAEMKQQLWNDNLTPWFSGPDDPNYTVLKITPTEIRLKNTQDDQTHKLEIKPSS